MKTLSKSKLLAYRQCPKRLWLEVHEPELRLDSAAAEASFATGHQVGAIARTLYDPDGTGTFLDLAVLGMPALLSQTKELLEKRKPIFEAGFVAGDEKQGALALADVLLPDGGPRSRKWRMVEVKSSTSVKDYHLDDVARLHSWKPCIQTQRTAALGRLNNSSGATAAWIPLRWFAFGRTWRGERNSSIRLTTHRVPMRPTEGTSYVPQTQYP